MKNTNIDERSIMELVHYCLVFPWFKEKSSILTVSGFSGGAAVSGHRSGEFVLLLVNTMTQSHVHKVDNIKHTSTNIILSI